MPIAACADPDLIVVSKSIVGDAFGAAGGKSTTLSDGDPVVFAISVRNVGGASVAVTITDTFDEVFTGLDEDDEPIATPTWTRTGPTGTVTTGSGNISSTVTIGAGQRVTYLVNAIYSPTDCTSLTVNFVSVLLPGDNCCGENEVYDWAKVINADGPRRKLDPTEGWTAMEALFHLLEGVALSDKVVIAKFVNECGTLADIIGADGSAGDGVAVALLDAFGDPTGLYAETSPGS